MAARQLRQQNDKKNSKYKSIKIIFTLLKLESSQKIIKWVKLKAPITTMYDNNNPVLKPT